MSECNATYAYTHKEAGMYDVCKQNKNYEQMELFTGVRLEVPPLQTHALWF